MSVSIRTVATFAVAIFLGLVAVLMVRGYIATATKPGASVSLTPTTTLQVVVAAQPIVRGTKITPNLLKIVVLPQDGVPAEAFHSVDQLTGGGQERLAMRTILGNETILPVDVSGAGGRHDLSAVIAPGMRAQSLRANDVVGVGGFALPGDRVDVLLTRAVSGGASSVTQTGCLAKNIRVLGVDQIDDQEAGKPVVSRAITVEVTPAEAQAISLGQSVGTVSLTLRHLADDEPLECKTIAAADLGPPRRAPAGGSSSTIRVIRGVDTSRFSLNIGRSLDQAAAASAAVTKTSAGVGGL
jgi:pilus assembly protein CpaB